MSDVANPPAANAPVTTVSYGAPEIIFATGISFTPTGDSLSVIFSDMEVNLTGNTLSAVKLVTFRLPVTLPAGKILEGFRADVHIAAAKDKGSRSIVFADIAGSSRLIEFPFATEQNVSSSYELLCPQNEGDLDQEHPFTPSVMVNLFVSVQRTSPASIAELTLSSIDLTAIYGGTKG
jgi:hypothetical protein